MNVMRNVFEGLYILGEDSKVISGVAKSYEVSEEKNIHIPSKRFQMVKWNTCNSCRLCILLETLIFYLVF